MHVPDGFLGPQTWLPAAGVAGAGWAWALRRVRSRLDAATIPALGVTTACCFALMLIAVPLPGGTTVHVTGIGLLAVRFGVPLAFLAVTLVLALQAVLLGDGGLTALPVLATALGLVGASTAAGLHALLKPLHVDAARFAAGFGGVVAAAVVVAVALGLQPTLGRAADGSPLYFPFGLDVTLPAVVLPHLAAGALDGLLTVVALRNAGGGR